MTKNSPFSCIYHPKALLLHQNILQQLWNTNLVLAVVLRLFVSTRILLNANVQAYNFLPLFVPLLPSNTPTNASAASASLNWKSHTNISKTENFLYIAKIVLYTLSVEYDFILDNFCVFIENLLPKNLHNPQKNTTFALDLENQNHVCGFCASRMKREAGESPAQSRCCKLL